MLPMGFGYVEGITHDNVFHGTTTLFAILNVLNGAVLATCKPRHRHQEFLSFLREIDRAVPEVSTYTASSTTTVLTSIPRPRHGWLRGLGDTCISPPLIVHGLTRWNAASR
jgi:transposase